MHTFIVKLWTEILKSDEFIEFMKNINIRSANHFSVFHHDHCMKSTQNPELLDEAFREGNQFKASAPPCRHEVGIRDIVVKGSAKRGSMFEQSKSTRVFNDVNGSKVCSLQNRQI